MKNTEENKDIICKVQHFKNTTFDRGISNIDRTHLTDLIISMITNKKFISFEGKIKLKDLQDTFEVKSNQGVKFILDRLNKANVFIYYKKIGKHHQDEYVLSIDRFFTRYFYINTK